jgi:hypothetical protein
MEGVSEQGAEENIWTEEGGSGRRLHNEELHDMCTSPDIIQVIKLRRMRWAGHVACMGKINAYNIFMGKPGKKRQLGRSRH